ncbi:hypothetical protein N7493_007055 [Penicillium malachiteum]|uniref:Uncharacterized protein n=1 Tax=Penicillium malachiteum TaxID=1324776 RepID=A0AAD6MV64_9EURO|nr:hypothetical protein N7493_007055 [Penicillium malachiteum]
MAAYNDGNTSRHKEWYDPDLQDVNPEIRYLLENYSKIPAAKVVDHVNEIVSSTCVNGCCFEQDLRQLVYDGVPSAQLIGLDIEGPLLDLG